MATRSESFKIVFPAIAELPRKSWELVDPSVVDPKGVGVRLYQGEYLTPFTTAGKMERQTAGADRPLA